MPETDPAIIGVHKCGCITLADARPDPLDKDTEKALARIIREGGTVERTTVGEARKRPYFLVGECPHDPKGWEAEVEKPFEPSLDRPKQVRSRGIWRVTIRTHHWTQGKFPAGEVREWDGAWWATEGWFNYRESGANDGGDPREPSPEYGPFKTKKAAMEHLLPLGIERGKRLIEKWAAERAAKQKAAA